MSLLAGLSQQGEALTAHNDDAAAHGGPLVKSTAGKSIRRGLVTFISDDGSIRDKTHLAPLFIARGIPCCFAIITGTSGDNPSGALTTAEIQSYQDDNGFEMCCHSVDGTELDTYTESELIDALTTAKARLTAWGITTKALVYPGGDHTALVRTIARRMFECAVATPENSWFNDPPIATFNLTRYRIEGATLDTLKSAVDEAAARGAWLIFMMHSHNVEWDDQAQWNLLEDLLDYIVAQEIPVVTVGDGFSEFQNYVDAGDHRIAQHTATSAESEGSGFAAGNDGSLSISSDYLIGPQRVEHVYNTGFGDVSSVANGGTVSATVWRTCTLSTNTTTGATARIRTGGARVFWQQRESRDVINWSRRMRLVFTFSLNVGVITDENVCRWVLGRTSTDAVGSLARRGVGFLIRGERVFGLWHDGTDEHELDLGYDVAGARGQSLIVDLDGAGGVIFRASGGAILGRGTTAPVGTSAAGENYLVAENTNGAGTDNCRFYPVCFQGAFL